MHARSLLHGLTLSLLFLAIAVVIALALLYLDPWPRLSDAYAGNVARPSGHVGSTAQGSGPGSFSGTNAA